MEAENWVPQREELRREGTAKCRWDINRRAQTHSYLQKGRYMHLSVCELKEVSLSTQTLSTQFRLFHSINTKSFIAINCLLTKMNLQDVCVKFSQPTGEGIQDESRATILSGVFQESGEDRFVTHRVSCGTYRHDEENHIGQIRMRKRVGPLL